MQSFRLLMTADTVGGVWTYALELIQSLAPYGYEVLLATLGKPLSPSQSREACALHNLTIAESSYKLEWMEEPWADVDASGAWLMELAEQFAPDTVHLNTYSHGALSWRVPVLVVGHSCVYSWWHAVKGEAPPPSWQGYYRRVQAGLRNADLVVTPTRAMLTELLRHYGPFADTQVIYNGRQPTLFAPRVKQPYIMALGRLWDEAKNIQMLEAIATHSPWPIYVAGDQEHPTGERHDFPNLHVLGQLTPSEVASWLARASIYVLPARYEPFGLSALEAALAGCALVLGDIPSLREVWQDAAVYTSPDDPVALTVALGNLAFLEHQREQLANSARQRARRYAPSTMAQAYHLAYQRLTANAAQVDRPIHQQGKQDALRTLLPLAPVGLESRQRSFSTGHRH